MSNPLKTTFTIIIGLLAIILILSAFLSRPIKNANSVQAYGLMTCEEPIPTTETLKQTLSLLNSVFQEISSTISYIENANEQIKGTIAKLSQGGDKICDYSVCEPRVINVAPDMALQLKPPFSNPVDLLDFRLPGCLIRQCIGDPCPDISASEEILSQMHEGVKGAQSIIHNILTAKTITVFEDIRDKTITIQSDGSKKENEKKGDPNNKITQPELVERLLYLTRMWFHPGAGGRKSCTLSSLERAKALIGEFGWRTPMLCSKALEGGLYWPKLWSENCETECNNIKDQAQYKNCANCLGTKKGTLATKDTNGKNTGSYLANINYKIYHDCKNKCKEDELTPSCEECLCKGKTSDECASWLCGGYYSNFVCCSETPLEGETLPSRLVSDCEPECSLLCLSKATGIPYPPQRDPQLQKLLNCIENKTGKPMPTEDLLNPNCSVSDPFYGTVCTYDHTYPTCNYTRGNKLCETCSHTLHSCHYGGKKGKEGALAVDFGNEANFDKIKAAVKACDPGAYIDREKDKQGYHIHISHSDCDTN